ncbi:fasciclin domain-containing protein [Flavisolibacter nicotianae]|uniref:fasciclin domain-containing protein n=1 Tax=Flavisolibacter nicotianae TaxID=2364882 RepID=UPI0013C3F9F7|nr:fasciclin domain-containing protein [Flavisolibacter nicotianae]
MKSNINKYIFFPLLAGAALFASCNKDVEEAQPVTVTPGSGQSIAAVINSDASFTILKAAIARAATSSATPSLGALLSDSTAVYTVFAPTDAAFQQSFALLGIPQAVGINAFSPGQLDSILRYHVVGGQKLMSSMLPSAYPNPNLQLPTLLELAKPSAAIPPGLRMPVFPSKINGAWVNNIPLTGVDIQASNGVIHKTGLVVAPPSTVLWSRIATDPNLTYLKAAIDRADTGVPADSTLRAAFLNPAANFTLFAPTNLAFQQLLTVQITQALMAMNVPQAQAQAQAQALASTPAVFANPALATVLTPTLVKGLIAYHLLGTNPVVSSTKVIVNGLRVFSANIPTTATNVKTYLNGTTQTYLHPGVIIQAMLGATGVTAATVKGVANATASNVQINPMPGTGTSDQHYVNGVLHVIDQVLRPQ